MFRDAALVAGKDLRIERRSRVTTQQIAPFAVLVALMIAAVGVGIGASMTMLLRSLSSLALSRSALRNSPG